MKALSVKQPWAGNIAIGRKTAVKGNQGLFIVDDSLIEFL